MKLQQFSALVLLAAIWGVSFLLIRVAAPILGPPTLITARMLIASGALLLYVFAMRRQLPTLHQSWKAFLILGLLNSALPLSLEIFAVLHIPPSLVAILLTAVPLFTALAAAVWLRERLTPAKMVGLLLGLLGVGVLVGWSTLQLTHMVVLAIVAVLFAALLYALAGIYAKVTFRSTPALSLVIGQELLSGIVMLPLTIVSPPVAWPTLEVLGATVVLALVMTAGGNLLYFYLLDHVGPTKTQSVAFLIPVFTLLASVMFFGESVTGGTVVGLGIIFAGVVLVNEVRVWPARFPRPAMPAWGLRTSLVDGASFPARLRTRSRPFRAWSVDVARVYDRHSTRRRTHERSSAMCA